MKRACHGAFCALRPVLALARPVSQRMAIGSHDCAPAPLNRSSLECGCGLLLVSAAGRGSNARASQANGPGLIQAYAVRTARSALQRRAIRAATVFGRRLVGFALAVIRSRQPSVRTTQRRRLLSKATSGEGAEVSCCCSLPGAEATQRCGRRAGRVDLGSGRPHRLKRPAPGASDPPSAGGVGP
jgi:hypothetical protein